jgi:hypothetical protein
MTDTTPTKNESLPSSEDFRLHLGELTAAELRVAKAAYRFALTREAPPEAVPVAWLDLAKMEGGGMAYATGIRVNGKQSPLFATPPAPQRLAQGEDVVQRANIAMLADAWRHVLTDGRDGHELCANRNTVACFVNAIDALTTQPPHQDRGEVTDAMVDAYLAAQAKAVQAVDDKWGNGGKAASYLHPVREACRAGLIAALTEAKQQGPGEAVYQVQWIAEQTWEDITAEQYALLDTTEANIRILYTAPQVEAKRQMGEGATDGR